MKMKNISVFKITTFFVIIVISLMIISCSKEEDKPVPVDYLKMEIANLELRHNLYYLFDSQTRAIELFFDDELDPATINGSILLKDKKGSLAEFYDVKCFGNVVIVLFHDNFTLEEGWKYELEVLQQIESVKGSHPAQTIVFELRTRASHIFEQKELKSTEIVRNAIVCISDVHMGDHRANAGQYSWFGKNKVALENFLDSVNHNLEVRQLVILGDLFDEWVVPYSVYPFNPQIGINNSKEYFMAIADAPTNKGIVDKLRSIAANPEIELVYVPGNHDMLITKDILDDIIPSISWAGDVPGLGLHKPVDHVVMEHGHRYDFFNTPQPLVDTGHMLPPGYFVSRLFAQGMIENRSRANKQQLNSMGSFEFHVAWWLVWEHIINGFDMQEPIYGDTLIKMGGIGGYKSPFSFKEAYEMYANDIEKLWPQTQQINNVPHPIYVLFALWNGHHLTDAVTEEYIHQSGGLQEYDIIAFGHSHIPLINVYPDNQDYTQVYVNTGSWVDADKSPAAVRTFAVIKPADWTGSDISSVQLYQYNQDSINYSPKLIKEENIELAK